MNTNMLCDAWKNISRDAKVRYLHAAAAGTGSENEAVIGQLSSLSADVLVILYKHGTSQ